MEKREMYTQYIHIGDINLASANEMLKYVRYKNVPLEFIEDVDIYIIKSLKALDDYAIQIILSEGQESTVSIKQKNEILKEIFSSVSGFIRDMLELKSKLRLLKVAFISKEAIMEMNGSERIGR